MIVWCKNMGEARKLYLDWVRDIETSSWGYGVRNEEDDDDLYFWLCSQGVVHETENYLYEKDIWDNRSEVTSPHYLIGNHADHEGIADSIILALYGVE